MSSTQYGGYSRTTYGATGGDDGGGFFGGSQSGSQAAKPVNDESLRPVTVKQIIDAEQAFGSDGPFRIDGVDVTQVTFVGMVRQISPQTTNITYRLDDGTGVVEVKQWLDPDKQQEGGNGPNLTEEQYVRVWGRLRSFGNKRHVGAHVIKPVTDFNEVNYHLLEATYVHLFFTKGGLAQLGGDGGDGTNAGGNGNDDSMFVENNDAAFMRSASAKAKRVFQYLNQSDDSNEGVNAHLIASHTGMSYQDVTIAAEELLGIGKIYTTLDDETFAILQGF